MPPKTRQRQQPLAVGDGRERHPRQLQEGAAAAATTWEAATSTPPLAFKPNAEYNSSLKSTCERILAHPKFVGITSKLGPGGSDFDQKLCEKNIGERGFHRFDGNAFMVALQLHGGVPVSRKRFLKWKDQY